ncbi:MAG: ribokinase [Kiritimatiellae bacterium]|nr:ribokinase [Kiritimatiellia bacterium]
MKESRVRIAVIGLVGRSMFFDVPRFHVGGETIHATGFHEEWGGKGFNQAIAAARQGANVSFLGKAGSEADATAIKTFCEKEGVEAHIYFPRSAVEPTSCAAILTDGTGETRVTVARGAELDEADVDFGFKKQILAADILLLNNEVPDEVNLRASEIAAANGVRILFNPAPARPIPAALAERVFLFAPNEFEEVALGKVACEVVTTLGARGCRIRSTGEIVPAPSVRAVDTTGAGDTFNGVLAVQLAEGATLVNACRAANEAAARSTTVRYVLGVPGM